MVWSVNGKHTKINMTPHLQGGDDVIDGDWLQGLFDDLQPADQANVATPNLKHKQGIHMAYA